jgi:hypothetical protein
MTNQGGAACGRCMKMCPYNNEGLLKHRVLLWVATRFPASRAWLAKLDDKIGHGAINPVKHWWAEIEMIGGKAVVPKHVNRRGVAADLGFVKKPGHRVSYVNADMLPPPNWREAYPVDRKAALAAAAQLETPAEARARKARGGPPPAHYTQTPPVPGPEPTEHA